MPSTTYTLTRDDTEIPLDVEYAISKYYPARGPSWSCAGEPAEGGEVEYLTVTHDGEPFAVTADEADQIEAHIYMIHEDDGDYCED